MNQTYRLVWSLTQQAWVVAGELARGRKKSSAHKALSMALLLAGAAVTGEAYAGPALNALPTGETVVSGRATFDRSVDKQLTINQSTNKLITNWNSFDVGSAAKVSFVQPNSNSIALNRVTSGSPTEVFGQVTANGRLVLVNPNGIAFGGRSQVNANALIASALDIKDIDFNDSKLLFSRGSATGIVENRGKLTATAGSVSLLAPTVKNSGSITVTRGDANLINANAVQLSSVTAPAVTTSTISGLIQQSGNITATQVNGVGGKIVLTGDKSQASSQIQLSGALQAAQTEANGRSILINSHLNLNGDSNKLALTSTDGYSLSKATAINLNGAHSGFSVNGTAYTVIRDVNQLQAINKKLDGKYVLANNIDASATVNWNKGAGFKPLGTETSLFKGVLDGLGHRVDGLTINRPTTDYVGLIGYTKGGALQNIGLTNVQIEGQNGTGALAGNLSQTSVRNSYVTGRVVGVRSVGGLLGSTVLAHVSSSHAAAEVEGDSNVGGLIGASYNFSTIESSYATGKISGTVNVAGLVGVNSNSSIKFSYATGAVSGLGSVGGLVGRNEFSSTVSDSYATGTVYSWGEAGGLVGYNDNKSTIRNSYATGNVSSQDFLGGLVGINSNTSIIENSYATGNISGEDNIGGLVGYNDHSSVNHSYAAGKVTGSFIVGGLVGQNYSSSIDGSYATGSVTGETNVGGLVGVNKYFSSINTTYATGSVTGRSSVGGLVGGNISSSIKTSYAAGKVTGDSNVGGLVGGSYSDFDSDKALIQNSYWNTQISGQSSGVGTNTGTATVIRLKGLNSTEFKKLASFANWGKSIDAQASTGSVWRIYEGKSAPLLRYFLNQ
jgi:filamentous hemagglutinin family protein